MGNRLTNTTVAQHEVGGMVRKTQNASAGSAIRVEAPALI
jgi:hypothetical protein